jgi:hypothetical protein
MTTNALGPTMAGGLQPIVENGFELVYLPDVNNSDLQREGKPPVFYYIPNQVHLARKNGTEDGDALFNLIRFAGKQTSSTTIGVEGEREVAGGVITFTISGQVPDAILKTSQKKILDQWNAKDDYFWGIRTQTPPIFRPAIVVANTTSISNVSPIANRGIPAVNRLHPRAKSNPALALQLMGEPYPRSFPRSVTSGRRDGPDSNLDPWYWNMQGQGPGSIDPTGQNAYSALLGAYPTAILWEAFHGTAGPLVVIQNLKLKVWTPVIEISIKGSWKKIFDHFSAALSARYMFASVDAAAEFNKMRINGDIQVDIKVDPTIPGGEKIAEMVDKRSDLIVEKFIEQAKKVIFDPPQPQVQAAQASSGFGLWGAGLSMKKRRDETQLELNYHETRQIAHLQDHTVSSSLTGMFDELKADPDAEKKYFLSVYMDDWPRSIGRIIRPVVNWPKPGQGWSGQPVAFVSAQVGYPDTQGALLWDGQTFQGDGEWKSERTQKPLGDVANPPEGWTPDKTFVKRKIHLLEPDDTDLYTRVQIDQNTISLDPEPNGTLLNDIALEVRADSAGKVQVGPISLGALLDDAKQTVEATFELTDEQGQSVGREAVKFNWVLADQDKGRYWSIFTSDPAVRPYYRYKVRVVIKGSLMSHGMEWEGDWQRSSGNGPITLTVPTPEEAVTPPRSFTPFGAVTSRTSAGARELIPAKKREVATASAANGGSAETARVAGWNLGPPAEDTPADLLERGSAQPDSGASNPAQTPSKSRRTRS